jgi:WD40 repeat protein
MNIMRLSVFHTRILFLLGIALTGMLLISHCEWRPTFFFGTRGFSDVDPDCQTSAIRAASSDGERFTVVTVFGDSDVTYSYPQSCIIDWKSDRIRSVYGRLEDDRFIEWTASQRYGIFYTSSHYGVTETLVFDTVQWQVIPEAGTECGMPYAMSPCYAGMAAISPVADQYLNNWGEIVDIPTGARTDLQSKEVGSIYGGAWSPDGTYLAYLVSRNSNAMAQSTLFLAQGDGSQTQEIADLPLPFQWDTTQWSWSSDGQQLVLTNSQDGDLQYILDIATRQLAPS